MLRFKCTRLTTRSRKRSRKTENVCAFYFWFGYNACVCIVHKAACVLTTKTTFTHVSVCLFFVHIWTRLFLNTYEWIHAHKWEGDCFPNVDVCVGQTLHLHTITNTNVNTYAMPAAMWCWRWSTYFHCVHTNTCLAHTRTHTTQRTAQIRRVNKIHFTRNKRYQHQHLEESPTHTHNAVTIQRQKAETKDEEKEAEEREKLKHK